MPIGLQLTRTARAVSQEFDRAMTEAGGSAVAWQVLLLIRSGQWGTQSGLAKAMGVTGPTMTHHLRSLEAQGLVRRWRDESNRRIHQVELTDAGIELFDRLRQAALRHDERLRSRLTRAEVDQLSELLHKLDQPSL
jgi:MarR family transcriptional regulator for hemolysin